ncbi:UDP-glucosyltransferase 2-like [Planococcus citri]|uniref:UDP-glucosyltransferase 2-like n=1 Tax=Planococcus citri TaxID=170843 RepID=UPI0031F750AB
MKKHSNVELDIFQKFCLIILILSIFNRPTDGAKILGVFAYPAKSHFTFDSAILKSLANAGHEITVITSFPADIAGENYTVIDTSNEFSIQVANTSYDEFRKWSSYSLLPSGFSHEMPLCGKLWRRKEIQDMMNSKEKLFDVIFVEIFYLYKCLVPMAHKMKIPVIGTMTYKSWLTADIASNNPCHPAYFPYENSLSFDQNSFYDRSLNVWNHISVYLFWYFRAIPFLNQFHKDNFQQIIPYSDYIKMEPSVIFYNSHHTFVSRPLNPNVIEVGGIHIKPAKPLPKNIKKFVEDAPNGVILFTFGSLVKMSSLSKEIINIFFNAFAQIPQKVIMKYETPLENVPKNVMVFDWLPQRDLLEHENVIAFISHCGQGGVYEAIYTATPIVALPLIFDQLTSAMYLERLGVAVNLDIDFLTTGTLLKALDSIVNDTRYQENMQKLSYAFKDRPLTPQQSVVYWTDYVIRHNGAHHLKPASSELNLLQYLLLDVIISFLVFLIVVLYFVYFILKFLYRFVFNFIRSSRGFQTKKDL